MVKKWSVCKIIIVASMTKTPAKRQKKKKRSVKVKKEHAFYAEPPRFNITPIGCGATTPHIAP